MAARVSAGAGGPSSLGPGPVRGLTNVGNSCFINAVMQVGKLKCGQLLVCHWSFPRQAVGSYILLHHFCTVTLAPLSPPPLHSQRYVQVLFRCHDFRAAVLGDTTTCPPTRSGSGGPRRHGAPTSLRGGAGGSCNHSTCWLQSFFRTYSEPSGRPGAPPEFPTQASIHTLQRNLHLAPGAQEDATTFLTLLLGSLSPGHRTFFTVHVTITHHCLACGVSTTSGPREEGYRNILDLEPLSLAERRRPGGRAAPGSLNLKLQPLANSLQAFLVSYALYESLVDT